MSDLCEFHNPKGGLKWRLTEQGIEVEDEGHWRTPGEPISVQYIWEDFSEEIQQASWEYDVPADMIVAMIAVEATRKDNDHFDPKAVREEPGYISDEKTPHLVSPGLMQTLISTAREMAKRYDIIEPEKVDRELLLDPFYSVMLGTAYIDVQTDRYGNDPVLMCAAYNAGGVYKADNKWALRVYGASRIDRFIKWFNDFRAALREDYIEPEDEVILSPPCKK